MRVSVKKKRQITVKKAAMALKAEPRAAIQYTARKWAALLKKRTPLDRGDRPREPRVPDQRGEQETGYNMKKDGREVKVLLIGPPQFIIEPEK